MRQLFVVLALVFMTVFTFVAMPSIAWAYEDENEAFKGLGLDGDDDDDNSSSVGSQSGNVQFFTAAQIKAENIFRNTKSLVYIVAAFGIMVLAVGAIFGKMAWKTFAYLAIGLLILAGAGGIIEYLTNPQDMDSMVWVGDTL